MADSAHWQHCTHEYSHEHLLTHRHALCSMNTAVAPSPCYLEHCMQCWISAASCAHTLGFLCTCHR
jgi:hypothetical protein